MTDFDPTSIVLPERYSRGDDNKFVQDSMAPVSVGLYAIDTAVLSFLQNKIAPVVTQDEKQIPVPIIYGSPERWKSAQIDGAIRDENGKVMLPIMMIRRESMRVQPISSAVNKYQTYLFKSKWNSRNIYDRFMVQNRITPSEAYYSTVIPDYYDIRYEGLVWTEYTEQMNKIIEDISFESNEYWGEEHNYRFHTKIDEYEQITHLPADNDRLVRSKFTMQTRAYILPTSHLDRSGNRAATIKMQYSPKKVVFSTEIVKTI